MVHFADFVSSLHEDHNINEGRATRVTRPTLHLAEKAYSRPTVLRTAVCLSGDRLSKVSEEDYNTTTLLAIGVNQLLKRTERRQQ